MRYPSQSPSQSPSLYPSLTTGYPCPGVDDAVSAAHTTSVALLAPKTRGREGPPSVERNGAPSVRGDYVASFEASSRWTARGPGSVAAGGGGRRG
jgi:hypothetical protein